MRVYQTYRLIFLISMLVSSCSVGPDYVKPSVAIPAKYKEANHYWKTAEPQDIKGKSKWWTIYHDAQLNSLEEKLLSANQNIVNAEANFRQAYSLVQAARAAYFPTITASASITRQKQTSFFNTNNNNNNNNNSNVYTAHSLVLDAVWEADIWGATRRNVEANAANAQSKAALLAATQLSLTGLLAQNYFQLRALDTDQKLLDETVRDNKKILQLVKNQYRAGTVARSDVLQAQSQLEATQALAINNGIARTQFEHAIAVLMGELPEHFTFAFSPLLSVTPPHLPMQIPSQLLERRPDIAAAERLMAQANAQVGVAVAAYYPALTVNAMGSWQNNGYANWLSVPGLAWAIGPQLAGTIFNGGALIAATAAARANYDATVATYRQTVLAAFQDVEDNLAALKILADEAAVQNQAARDAKLALKLVLNQYKAGVTAYSNVLTAQIAAYTAEKNAADITGLRMVASAGLIKALGGSWT